MSTTVATKSISLTPRAVEAVWRAIEELGVSDPKLLASVIVEVASDELQTSGRFSDRVRYLYDSLSAAKKKPASKGGPKMLPAHLKPIRQIEGQTFDIGAPPDPYFLLDLFGAEQLPEVLKLYSVDGLIRGAEIVQERRPDAKPLKAAKTKAPIIKYILQYVV
jgi:hypothetical protein